MSVAITILLFIVGLILIIKGGDWFVDAASWIAEITGIPKIIVGATIVSIATTLPELIVSLIAVVGGDYQFGINNAVGSVVANTGLIMGISVSVLPAVVKRSQIAEKGAILFLSVVLLLVFSLDGRVNLLESLVLIVILAVFLALNVINAKKESSAIKIEKAENDTPVKRPEGKVVAINVAKFVVGAAAIVGGAQLLVTYGKELAKLVGVPDAVIAVTMVAIGTSLPELVTTITSLVKKESDMSIGNILGANIIDLCMILPVCSFASNGSLTVEQSTWRTDIPVGIIVFLIAIIPALLMKKFKRVQGIAMLAIYIAYSVLLFVMPGFTVF